jgi:hypothetical protein
VEGGGGAFFDRGRVDEEARGQRQAQVAQVAVGVFAGALQREPHRERVGVFAGSDFAGGAADDDAALDRQREAFIAGLEAESGLGRGGGEE